MKDHHIDVFFSDDDDAYVADIPDLRACSALGATPEAAVREVMKAKIAWIAAAKSSRRAVPRPRYRPVHCQIA